MGYVTKDMITRNCLAIEKLFPKNVPNITILKYILSLLVLKRSSDLRNEANAILDELDDDMDGNYSAAKKGEDNVVFKHEFCVPEISLWSNITQTESKIGDSLNRGFSDLIENNKDHHGFIPFNHLDSATIDFNSKLLGDLSTRERILTEAVSYISELNLGNQGLEKLEELDEAVDKIIDYFVVQHPEIFVTPDCVTKLLIGLSDLESNSILLPEAGEGKIIQRIIESFKIQDFPKRSLGFKAFVPDKCMFFVTCMRMFLHEYTKMEIIPGIIALETNNEKKIKIKYKFTEHNNVLGSIPLEIQKRTETEQEYIEGNLFSYGIPLNKKSEFSYLLGMRKNTVSGGKLVVAVPPQILYKQRSEGLIRENLVKDDYIEAVIQLPSKIYSANQAAYAILVIKKFKTTERKGKILFVDASRDLIDGKKQNDLSDETVNEILSLYHKFDSLEGKSRLVTIQEIAECEYTLDVNRYVNTVNIRKDDVDLMEKLHILKNGSTEKGRLVDIMIESLANLENLQHKLKTG